MNSVSFHVERGRQTVACLRCRNQSIWHNALTFVGKVAALMVGAIFVGLDWPIGRFCCSGTKARLIQAKRQRQARSKEAGQPATNINPIPTSKQSTDNFFYS